MGKRVSAQQMKALGKVLATDFAGALLLAIGIYSFAYKAGFAPGGISGIAIIINYFFPSLNLGFLSLVLNVPLVMISLRFLGKRFLLKTIRTLVIYSLLLDYVVPRFPVYSGNALLAAIFAGVFSGAGLAVVYANGSCTGGSDLLIMTARKLRPHLSIGQITLAMDGLIIISGGFTYNNIDAILYGFLYTAVATIVMDKIMYGFVSGKMILIITEHGQNLGHAIDRAIARGSTIMKGRGSYSGLEKEIVLCACNKQQLPRLRQIVKEEDEKALVIVLEYNEVYGTGFLPMKEQT